MRIDRLALHRYGHLSDVELAFPANRGLHVVLGANEAGKSTALAAIGDALFGFPHRSDFAFLHDTKDLRLSIAVRAGDGRAEQFVRLKRRKDDLLDGHGRPLPESAMLAFLGGATRERFERVFGLDAAELRRGGAAMLEDKGEVGESILQAHTGMGGFRALVEKLGRDAAQLYGDRRGARAFHVAADQFKAARQALDAQSVEPADYKDKRAAQQRLTEARDANGREAETLHAERARLERIRRTAPALRARAVALAEREAMGEVAKLPADADARRERAMLALSQAVQDLTRERARDQELARDLATLIVDAALLAEADAIDALTAEQNRITKMRPEREMQRTIASQNRRAVEEAGRRLGLSDDAATLAARVPGTLARAAAKRATDAHERLVTRLQTAAETVATTAQRATDADAALAAMPPAEPFAALRAAIEAARAEGRIDDDLRQARTALSDAGREVAKAIAALPLWSGDAAALAAAPVPLDAMVAKHAKILETAETEWRTARDKRAGYDAELQIVATDLTGLSDAADLPTEGAIADARSRRDRAWRVIRRHRLEGGASPSDAELADLPSSDLPDALEALTRTADALADRRTTEADRLARFAHLRVRQAQQTALQADALAAETKAQAGHEAALAAWRDVWRTIGIEADEPAVMREWLRQRVAVLAHLTREDDARRKLSAITARHADAFAALAALLPESAAQAGDRVSELVRAATLICVEREKAEAALSKARASADDARAAAEAAARTLAKLNREQDEWRAAWAPIAATLGLRDDAAAEDGKQALEDWNRIDILCRDWRAAEDRVGQMDAAISGFEAAAAPLAGLAPDLPDPHALVRTLAERLALTRAATTERARIAKERAETQKRLAAAADAHTGAETTLASLRALAGAEDDAQLQAAIARAAEHAALSKTIAERDAELAREDRPLADLTAEAEGIDLDTLPARLAQIEQRLREIADENAAFAGQLTDLRRELTEMEYGHDAAGAAQAMANALADMKDIAERYQRLRLAHTLLRAGIDRFRRQQQGPLLARAGALFARLTEDRYRRLSVEEADDGTLTLVAVRPDNSGCPADRLSEGTRDQLYLALRLAAIEGHAVRTDPLPFIADDLLVNFDDRRARAALRVLAEFAQTTQTILFTHHAHIADMADPATASLHRLAHAAFAA
jgi:uncharacterized protein YhaN